MTEQKTFKQLWNPTVLRRIRKQLRKQAHIDFLTNESKRLINK